MTTRENTERDLRLAESAARAVGAPFRFATCGWRLGTRDDALWMHQRAPKSWAASSINTGLGRDPVEAAYGAMHGRPRLLNAGLLLRIVAEPLHTLRPSGVVGSFLVVSAVAQWLAGLGFVLQTWRRVKER